MPRFAQPKDGVKKGNKMPARIQDDPPSSDEYFDDSLLMGGTWDLWDEDGDMAGLSSAVRCFGVPGEASGEGLQNPRRQFAPPPKFIPPPPDWPAEWSLPVTNGPQTHMSSHGLNWGVGAPSYGLNTKALEFVPMGLGFMPMGAYMPMNGLDNAHLQRMAVTKAVHPGSKKADAFSTMIRNQFHKTKMCKFFESKTCDLGDNCPYAHTREELINTPDLTKTRFCKKVSRGTCTDANCKFAHTFEELRSTHTVYKTKLCRNWMGDCKAGGACRYAHSPEELVNEEDE